MKNQSPKKVNTAPKDYTVLEVMIAIFLLAGSIFCLRLAEALPLTTKAFAAMQNATTTALIIYGVVAVASVAMLIWNFNTAVFRISKHTLAISILGIVTSLIFRTYFTDRMTFLYFLHICFYSMYIIYMLYRAEFFTVSLMTAFAGWTFYSLRGEVGFTRRTIIYTVVLALVCVLSVVVAWKASGAKGYLKLFGKKKKVFSHSFQPTIIILTAALWLLCLIASLIFGSMCAYYCMFAAVAYELIAAVYYTFQLK